MGSGVPVVCSLYALEVNAPDRDASYDRSRDCSRLIPVSNTDEG